MREHHLSGTGQRRQAAIIGVACLLVVAGGVVASIGLIAGAAWLAPRTVPVSALSEGAAEQGIYLGCWWLIAIAYSPFLRKRVSAVGVLLAISLMTVLVGRLNQYPIFATLLTMLPQGALNILLIDSPLPQYAPHGFSGTNAGAALLVWAAAPAVFVFARRRFREVFIFYGSLIRVIRVRSTIYGLVGLSLVSGLILPNLLAEQLPWTLKPSWLIAEAGGQTPAAIASEFFHLVSEGRSDAAEELVDDGRTLEQLLPDNCSQLSRGADIVGEDDTTRDGPGYVRLTLQQRYAGAIVSRELGEAKLISRHGFWRLVSVTSYGEC
jgi:hypothetical protein